MLKAEFILPKRKRLNRMFEFDLSYIMPIIFAFFIGRSSIMDQLTPFGIAFLTSYILVGKANIYIFFSTILSIFSFHGLQGIDYAVTATIIMVIYSKAQKIGDFTLIKSSVIAGIISILIKCLSLFIFKEIFIYDLFLILFEGLVIFTLTYIFSYSFSTEFIGSRYTNERIICTFITFALILLGVNNFSIFGASIKNIISILFILYFGFTEGALMGGAIGITLGMISYISQPEMPFILSTYGLAGILSGVFKDLGKGGSILGFLLGNGIISFYINGYGTSFISMRELIVSIIMFTAIYKPLNNYLSGYMNIAIDRTRERTYSRRKDQMTIKRLNDISNVFKELSATFEKTVNDKNNYSFEEMYELMDDVGSSTCADCGMRKFCWEEGFYTTYYSIFNIISLIENNNQLTDENLPESIRDYCINKDKLLREIRRHFNIFKINNAWENKIIENRVLVSEQLAGVANIMDDMIKDIYIEPVFKEDVEEVIWANLKNKKVDVRDVVVIELGEGNVEFYIEVDRGYKEKNNQDNVRRIVSDTVGIPLKGIFTSTGVIKEKQTYKFVKSNRYNALTEIASKANDFNEISGDNYTFGEGENGYFAALSDGMGVGKKANNESSIAINLLEKFLEAKFDKELTLKTINSILMLKSNEEIFTTFDISLVDLHSGKLQVIKTGSPATFIKKKDEVKMINSQSLPVGILKDVDFNIYEDYLEDGDILIMMSDGVLEANENVDDMEKWMKQTIESIDSLNPKVIANSILDIADKASVNAANDDMTVLVTKVWKNI